MLEPAVKAFGLSKRYGERHAVRDVDWSVPRGSVQGLVGPNGAGKTTLLRMVLGLVSRTSGHLMVGGSTVVAGAPPPRTGALIEAPGFASHLSGQDNLRLLTALRGLDDAAVAAALDRVSLGQRARDRYRTYSQGMKQRLGVAAALLGEPALLVLDEPSNGLDPDGIADVRDLVLDLAAQGVTVVVSSHALADVERSCDRVGVMMSGRIVANGSVAELVGSTSIKLRTGDDRVAATVVASLAPELTTTSGIDGRGAFLDVAASPDVAPHLVAALVSHEVAVFEVGPYRRSLGDLYRTLLEEGHDASAGLVLERGPARRTAGD